MGPMKTVVVDCGSRRAPIEVPDDAAVLEYVEDAVPGEPAALVEAALDAPLGLAPLEELVRALPPPRRIVVAVDDPNRPAATMRAVLPAVLRRLAAGGADDREITLVSANGMHPKFSRAQLAAYLGEDVMRRFDGRVLNHDCEDPDGLTRLGVTEFGDVVEYHRAAMESDLLVYVGNVAVNIWGGYSGSGVVVGLGGTASMPGHHGRGGIGHPASCHGDPRTMHYQARKAAIHDALERARGRPVFYAEALTDGRGVVECFAGHARALRERTWAAADRRFVRAAPAADVVVVGLAPAFLYGPSDNPLIALTGVAFPLRLWLGAPLLRPGGVVIGVTESTGTVDPATHPGYLEAIRGFGRSRSFDALEREGERVGRDPALLRVYRAGGAYHPFHPFWLFNEDEYAMRSASRIVMAGARPGELFEALGCLVTPGFPEAWEEACRQVGTRPRVVVLPSFWSRPRIKFQVAAG
jgi:hypothetical protein